MNCRLCQKSDVEIIEVRHPFFRHMDFETIRPSAHLYRCRICRLLQIDLEDAQSAELDRMYRGERYTRSIRTEHTVCVPEFPDPVPLSFLQVEILGKILDHAPKAILDIGCFDGRLLREFGSRFPVVELHGFDINETARGFFPKGGRFHFWSGHLEKLHGPFDLVCLSHSLICIPDLRNLFQRMSTLLTPKGSIFIQLPDISKNPYAILYTDQYTYFTTAILSNTLSLFGFEWTPIPSSWFPREILGIANPSSRPVVMCEDTTIHDAVAYLNSAANQLKSIPNSCRTGVLGTTLNAAWVDSLRPSIQFFVDENPGKVGRMFRGKPVIHPSDIESSDQVILPYGPTGTVVLDRFEKTYPGTFIHF